MLSTSQKPVKITEFYDIFDVKIDTSANPKLSTGMNLLPSTIKGPLDPSGNPFSGFNNFPLTDPSSSIQAYNPNASQHQIITGKHKANQAISAIHIESTGDIYCYPPNVSVPYWDKIIFRTYEYSFNDNANITTNGIAKALYDTYSDKFTNLEVPSIEVTLSSSDKVLQPIPSEYVGKNNSADPSCPSEFKKDLTGTHIAASYLKKANYETVPLFLKFDQYQSRSKVIFSNSDKTYYHDIEFDFNYKHGQMEPIKLNLSLSANNFNRDSGTVSYNNNLTLADMQEVLKKCYWSIEWIYNPVHGN